MLRLLDVELLPVQLTFIFAQSLHHATLTVKTNETETTRSIALLQDAHLLTTREVRVQIHFLDLFGQSPDENTEYRRSLYLTL